MKKVTLIIILAIAGFLQYCSSSKKVSAPAMAAITYTGNVQPTISSYCSPCHIPPKGFKKALDTYDAAKANIDDMIARIKLNPGDKGFMPFKHARLSDSVINIFVHWKEGGLAEK